MSHALVEIFLWLLGLTIGSFLNVVVYRLNAGFKLTEPLWSFCPHCHSRIAWYDNLPVLSWVLLKARCRTCRAQIAVQYPLVEAATGTLFVLLYHLLFVTDARYGFSWGDLPRDLPFLFAWLFLGACLVVCAALDIISYTVDIRVTNLTVAAGILLYAFWPRDDFLVLPARGSLSAAVLAAFIVGLIVYWLTTRPGPMLPAEADTPPAADGAGPSEEDPLAGSPASAWESPTVRAAGGIATLLLVALVAYFAYLPIRYYPFYQTRPSLVAIPVAATLVLFFVVLVLTGGQRRAADEEIHEAIEAERPQARRVALLELLKLLPAILAGTAVALAFETWPAWEQAWNHAVGWHLGTFVPWAGALFAIRGVVLAAAAGWALRIVFTLIYGREAFGVGDIYILAAAGAVAGADIALYGLLLSVGVALAAWLLSLLLKRALMVPFGPWLAVGFVLALWLSRRIHEIFADYYEKIAYTAREQPLFLVLGGGMLLVAGAVAVVLSRLVRTLVEPRYDESDEEEAPPAAEKGMPTLFDSGENTAPRGDNPQV